MALLFAFEVSFNRAVLVAYAVLKRALLAAYAVEFSCNRALLVA